MKILQLTAHYLPNVGGVETHLQDLVNSLIQRKYDVYVLTYQPLTTKVKATKLEKLAPNSYIFRIPWFPGFFYNLVKYPLLEFLYLMPGLWIYLPFILIRFRPNVIQAHGLVAGAVGIFWGKLFNKRVVLTTHSIYHFPQTSFYTMFVRWMFSNADHILTLSEQSKREVLQLGIPSSKITVFTYWINLSLFKPIKNARKKLKWKEGFILLFVGRLISEKGIVNLLQALRSEKNIQLKIIGVGPLEREIKKQQSNSVIYTGNVKQNDLPLYYSAADALIVPSTHEEGFGRVIIESLACGTPVIAAKIGAIPEAMDETVGFFTQTDPQAMRATIKNIFGRPQLLIHKREKAVEYARKHYSSKNIETIIRTYTS